MARCSLCGGVNDGECPRCKYPDHMVERKFNKHQGKPPTSRHQQDSSEISSPKRWPKFKPGTAQPGTAEPVT